MQWFILAFLASSLWAVVVIVDKFVLTHHIKDAFSYQIFLTITLIPSVLVLFIFSSFHLQNYLYLSFYLTIFVIGTILGLFFVLYNKALLIEEVSRVTPLFYLSPLFVLLFASLFLGESLSLKRYLGIGLLFFSAISVSLRRAEHKSNSKSLSLSISPALLLMLFLDLTMAGKDVLAKFFFSYMDYWSYLFWFILGNIAGRPLLLLLPGIRGKFIADMKSLSSGICLLCLLCFINSSLACIGYVLYFKAVSLTYVSLVSAIPSTMPFLVFLLAIMLSVFYPGSLKESIERKGVIIKGFAVIMILIGSYLIVS